MIGRGGSFQTDTRGETRRLAVLALCALALIVAAFAFPGTLGSPTGGGPGNETTPGEDGPGSPVGPGDLLNLTGDLVNVTGGPGGDGEIVVGPWNLTIEDGEVAPEDAREIDMQGCLVLVGAEPTPGARVPVYVIDDGDLASDVPVSFNGESIGRTNANGRVVGQVPYREELSVSVSMPGVEDCRFETPRSLAGGEGSGFGGATVGSAAFDRGSLGVLEAAAAQSEPTGTFPVDGEVRIGVDGEPYPGDTVTIAAVVDGVPMRDAAVRVDGERVGRTGDDGTYELRVPDDGRERISVTVERGDFVGSGTLDVLTLDVALHSDAIVTLPGDDVTATVTVDGRAIPGASVAAAGEDLGSTDHRGQVDLVAPADPTATVVARHDGMTGSAAVWPLYVPLVLAVVIAVGAIVAATARYGRRRGLETAAAVGAVTVAYAAYRIDGRRGLVVAVIALGLAGLAYWYRTHRRRVAEGTAEAGDAIGAFVEWLATAALRAVVGIERLLAGFRALLGRIATRLANAPRSVRGLAAALVGGVTGFLASIPGRLVAALAWLLGLPFAAVAGIRSALRRDGSGDADDVDDSGEESQREEAAGPATGADADDEPDPISLREAWRRFARRVAGDWRRRTPGEVARVALDEGLPRESVLALTEVFRDVEYGDRPPSEERVERAREAFRAIDAHEPGDPEASD